MFKKQDSKPVIKVLPAIQKQHSPQNTSTSAPLFRITSMQEAQPTYSRNDRRSCEECRRMHKKCDRKFPICDRCAKRGSTCVYEPRKNSKTPFKAYPTLDANRWQEIMRLNFQNKISKPHRMWTLTKAPIIRLPSVQQLLQTVNQINM